MEVPEIARFAGNFSVMVRIQGPDPKGLKMRRHAFHLHQSGTTTLSASGLLLPPGSLNDPYRTFEQINGLHHSGGLVVTVASIIEPFLIAKHRDNPTEEFPPKLIPGALIDVLVEGKREIRDHDEPGAPCWLPCQLLALVEVSASSDALLSLLGAHSGSFEQASWEFSWSLAPLSNDPPTGIDSFQKQGGNDLRSSVESYGNASLEKSNNPTSMAKAATRIAFLGVSTVHRKDVLHIDIAGPQRKGDFLLLMGSPFGILSPLHFYNSISVGAVANCCPSTSGHSSLLMADLRCFPGMEGSPVFDKHGFLAGILTRPLKQTGGSAEIQLVISWGAITTTWSNELQKKAERVEGELITEKANDLQKLSLDSCNNIRSSVERLPECPDLPCLSQSSLEKAIASVVLVTVGDGVWASGIVINNHGLILTNAHILEPWRFGRTSLLGLTNKTTTSSTEHGRSFSRQEENACREKRRIFFPSQLGRSNTSVSYRNETSFFNLNYKSNKKISVRLDYVEHRVWYDARVVYISKGPWDVALLQLDSVPNQLCAITPEFACPSKGTMVHVIGHGLLGPRSDIPPSISSGVLACVVRIPGPVHNCESSMMGIEKGNVPVMLQTTAAVHPGASGGAVVNSDGRMIGLITSNARHGGGAIIPHMNFSIPCVALEPIFKFADKQDPSILKVMDRPNELLSSVWALMPPPSARLQSAVEKNNDGKGSRFSQFLAEKHTGISTLEDQMHLIKGKFPSKI